MSLNDLFGSYPGRPDHPDFAKLSEIVLQQDGRSYDADFDTHMARFVDPDSLGHMARERSRRIADGLASNLTMEDMVSAFSALYLDAFMLGYLFHERKVRYETESMLTASLASDCSLASERSSNILGDWQGLVDVAKERAALLGIDWKDSFIPDYVRSAIYPEGTTE
jgi:hypothetical protein